jgi:uncharacterized membrane protein required for colicin V production
VRVCYVGYGRGGTTEAIHLLGIVFATALASNGYVWLSQRVASSWTFDPAALEFVCFLLLLLVGLLLVYRVMYRLAAAVLREGTHQGITQWLGTVVGAARGLWWTGLVLTWLLSLGVPYLAQSVQERSLLGPQTLHLTTSVMHGVLDRLPGGSQRPGLMPGIALRVPQWSSDEPPPKAGAGSRRRSGR